MIIQIQIIKYQFTYLEEMVESDVLKFGDFTLKSGRKSPFFMNAGAYVTGSQLSRLGEYYAKAIHASYGDDFDVLFGPAYKGIPLAVGVYVQYWFEIPQWVPAIACLVILMGLNLLTVKLFGELEFWFAIIKIITIVALIGIGIFLLIIGFQTDTGTVSVSNLWDHGGLFPNGITGFLLSFQLVVFAFVGVELVGVSAAETDNPRKNIPSAINKIPFRILLFYIGALFVILCINPWNQLTAANSPFVQIFTLVGIPIAAGIINFVVLTSAASAGNSGLFSTSRMMFNLSKHKQGPKSFSKLNKNHVPSNALITSTLVVSLGAPLC